MITQEELKEVLRYDPDTGHFKWISGDPQFYRVGIVAGGLTGSGYIIIGVKCKKYLAHRLAWFYVNGVWPKEQIDHINHIRDDNRWINLRCVTAAENQRNRTINSGNTSGVSGVTSGYKERYWVASISADKKLIRLGVFADKFEAICARKSANNKYGYHSNHGQQPKDNKMTTPEPSYEDLFYSDEELINNLEAQLEQANNRRAKRTSRPARLFDPLGRRIIVKAGGLRRLCREFSLSASSISAVLLGKDKQHKGWTGEYI